MLIDLLSLRVWKVLGASAIIAKAVRLEFDESQRPKDRRPFAFLGRLFD
jgi:hypothetical protein